MTTSGEGLRADDLPGEDVLEDDEIIADEIIAGEMPAPVASAWRHPSRRRWVLFAAIALSVVVLDQLSKSWIMTTLAPGESMDVLGSWLRFVHWTNSGILFGMLPQSGPAFAVVSIIVVGLIGVYHARAGRGLVTTVALGLLLGGALGNLVDRLRYGAVVDWVDMGIGGWRFYTYNVADAAISTAIVLLLAMAVIPSLADWAVE
ncbi:MAG: signal peptidase II [Chloroflexi bacterium]|nr:signal peptidase II [Chloroflexota bacterium]